MQLRTALFCSFLAVPLMAACGDDSGGGGGSGGDGSTSGSSSTGSATGSGTGSTTSSAATGSAASTGAGGNTTTSGSTGSAASTGSGEGGGDPELSCQTYCDTIMDACSDDPQYPDEASCLAACASFPEGAYADSDGSLGCHQYHADAAVSGPDVHCIHAGPMGGGQCAADPCENFCEIAPAVCPDVYASTAVCEKVCGDFEVGDFSVSPPATGDTLGCRMYHLTVAAQSVGNAAVHCEHTAAVSSQCN